MVTTKYPSRWTHGYNSDFYVERVYNILDHVKEADRIIYEDPDEESGFVILPDL
jgi:m7GpppX diphosphatase